MRKLAQAVHWNQEDYEIVGYTRISNSLLKDNNNPAIIIDEDGSQIIIDIDRDGELLHILDDDETEYGVLEAEVIGDE